MNQFYDNIMLRYASFLVQLADSLVLMFILRQSYYKF